MCGIVAGVANHNIVPILVQGLERLEYRGYDSCGLAILDNQNKKLARLRTTNKVSQLKSIVAEQQFASNMAIAHTRWATHGSPVVNNAHPHFSYGPQSSKTAPKIAKIGVVHNGIIENYVELREELSQHGYEFESQTDSEVIAHMIDYYYQSDLLAAFQQAFRRFKGAFAIAVCSVEQPQHMVAARNGIPLVFGIDANHLIATSDSLVLAGVTNKVIYLEDGDVVDFTLNQYQIYSLNNGNFSKVVREIKPVDVSTNSIDLGTYQHYMQKEIFEQPEVLSNTLEGVNRITPTLFGQLAQDVFTKIDNILILACGTSYYSGCCAKYWLEELSQLPTQVEIASEYRYRTSIPNPRTLVVVISQSGETADTLSALKHAKQLGMDKTLAICNVSTSSMVRESKLAYITRAGTEIGVASTKAFTTQLASLFLLALVIAKLNNKLSPVAEQQHLSAMRHLPVAVKEVLNLEPSIIAWAKQFATKENALFLGRGIHFPIALEGALKLKEISYIHAEAYPAGELKHGPLALVTEELPVVVVAPNDELLEKLISNMQEVKARGGILYVLADAGSNLQVEEGINLIKMPEHYGLLSPILHVVPLQLLAYHSACLRGTNVDKPRNLAKSVTVE